MPQLDNEEMTGDEVIEQQEHDGRINPSAFDYDAWDKYARENLSFNFWDEQPTFKISTREKIHGDYDNTSLDPSKYDRTIHRDYLAHVLRWGWIVRQIRTALNANNDLQVIEVGCGRETSLFRALANSVSTRVPKRMTLVDINKTKMSKIKWVDIRPEFDFVTRWPELLDEGLQYDLAVNTEVIEHVSTPLGLAMLEGINKVLVPGGDFFISTPVYGNHRAVNHIREYTVPELQEMLELQGFEIVKRYGTFASWNDIKKAIRADESMSDSERKAFEKRYEEAASFYGHDVLACYLAPIYPDASRNNIWHCKKK